jgi:hypothetical protein
MKAAGLKPAASLYPANTVPYMSIHIREQRVKLATEFYFTNPLRRKGNIQLERVKNEKDRFVSCAYIDPDRMFPIPA